MCVLSLPAWKVVSGLVRTVSLFSNPARPLLILYSSQPAFISHFIRVSVLDHRRDGGHVVPAVVFASDTLTAD